MFTKNTDARRYSAYQLVVQSELELPELPEWSIADGEAASDVQIKFAPLSREQLLGGQFISRSLWTSPDSLWLRVPEIGQFLVSNGREILIDPVAGIDEDSIRLFLLGSAFGALLFQRGLLVMHGNAIQIGEQCMICVGPSGAGKSTTAAGFMQRGYSVLADDVVPIDADCRALPGFPRIKLWQDAAQQLAVGTTDLRRIRPNLDKFNLPLERAFSIKKLPVRWIYILDPQVDATAITVKPIHGMNRFLPLQDNTYRLQYLQGMALEAEHLKLCGLLAGRIHLARVTRPQTGFHLDALMDTLLQDMKQNP
jgi:hypothetical protein